MLSNLQTWRALHLNFITELQTTLQFFPCSKSWYRNILYSVLKLWQNCRFVLFVFFSFVFNSLIIFPFSCLFVLTLKDWIRIMRWSVNCFLHFLFLPSVDYQFFLRKISAIVTHLLSINALHILFHRRNSEVLLLFSSRYSYVKPVLSFLIHNFTKAKCGKINAVQCFNVPVIFFIELRISF